jgi:hypothetical protein
MSCRIEVERAQIVEDLLQDLSRRIEHCRDPWKTTRADCFPPVTGNETKREVVTVADMLQDIVDDGSREKTLAFLMGQVHQSQRISMTSKSKRNTYR